MEDIKVIRAALENVNELQIISRKTFFETFSGSNTGENMTKYLQESFSLEKLKAELQNDYSQFYFAMLGSEVIGYLKLNFGSAQTELQDNDSAEIERIYVLHDYHGTKVGQLLFQKAMEIAIEQRVHYLWLGVWEENLRAIRFYKKNGFVEFDKHLFKLGDEEQTDIMMKKILRS